MAKLNVSIEQENLNRLQVVYNDIEALAKSKPNWDVASFTVFRGSLNQLRQSIKHAQSLVHKASQCKGK